MLGLQAYEMSTQNTHEKVFEQRAEVFIASKNTLDRNTLDGNTPVTDKGK